MRQYTGKGVGKIAAKKVFDLFPGKWKVIQIRNNYVAQAFWRKVISEYTNDIFYEKYNIEDDRCSVQEFESQRNE